MLTFRDEMWVKSKLPFIHIILEALIGIHDYNCDNE